MTEESHFFQTLSIRVPCTPEIVTAHFVAALWGLVDHEYFRYQKPSLEARVIALRSVADMMEAENNRLQKDGLS